MREKLLGCGRVQIGGVHLGSSYFERREVVAIQYKIDMWISGSYRNMVNGTVRLI